MRGGVTGARDRGYGGPRGGGGRIHHQSKSGIITERFITRGHRSVMPIHVCQAVFEYPADVYLYISVNPRNIQEDGFSAPRDLDGPRHPGPRGFVKVPRTMRGIFARWLAPRAKRKSTPPSLSLSLLPQPLAWPLFISAPAVINRPPH